MISIITPCLNSEKTIEQTINSVLNQKYTDFEYIIIDGNSSDHTVDIIKEYIPLFGGRMRYISEEDDGILLELSIVMIGMKKMRWKKS